MQQRLPLDTVSAVSTIFVPASDQPNTAKKFNIEETIRHRDALIYKRKQIFDPSNPEHTNLISKCTKDFIEKFDALKNIDKHILIGLAVGIAAATLAFIFPVSLIGLAGFAYSAFRYGERVNANREYRAAFDNLKSCLDWTMGDVDWAVEARYKKSNFEDSAYKALPDAIKHTIIAQKTEGLTNCKVLTEMYDTISPLMNHQQLLDALDDDIEKEFALAAEKKLLRSSTPFLKRSLNNEERAVYFSIYGLDQGGVIDFLKGLVFLATQCFKATKNWAMGLAQKNGQQAAPANEQQSASADANTPRVAATSA